MLIFSASFLLGGERSTNQLDVALDCCLAGLVVYRVYMGGVKWFGDEALPD